LLGAIGCYRSGGFEASRIGFLVLPHNLPHTRIASVLVLYELSLFSLDPTLLLVRGVNLFPRGFTIGAPSFFRATLLAR
jgi:hypothetical protein